MHPRLTIASLLVAGWVTPPTASAQRQLEALDRGVVAVRSTSSQAFVGWRLLGDDPPDASFNVYRSSDGGTPVKLNAAPLTGETHFSDSPDFSKSLTYTVRPVVGGIERTADGSFSLPASAPVRSYFDIPLQRPVGGTSPDGTGYTYTANDASVGDLDGDGRLEIVLRWEPTNSWGGGTGGHTGPVLLDAYKLDGTRLWRIDLGRNINASAHITVFLVFDFDGDGKAEVACMTADGSIDGTGQAVGDPAADHRNANGVVLVGPEYLTVFNGANGAALASTLFVPQRHPGTLYPTPAQIEAVWDDGYGNRVNRFLGGVAYLDGKRPSIVFSRGYYTRSVIAAWDWRGGRLTGRWVFDSDDGTPGNAAYRGQGNHNLSIADVDDDGFDEIVYGSCTIDHDGKGLYSTGLHHGDALHVADMDPDRPGLEVFMPHESPGSNGGIGTSFRDARTGTVIWSTPASSDVGRGVAFDIDPAHPGFEAWASNSSSHFNARGEPIATSRPSTYNFAIWWDGQPTRELLDDTRIDRWNPSTLSLNRLLTGSGVSSNNGTKATPCFSGDILGDWREEVVWRTSDNNSLRVHTTTIPTTVRLTTLLHDPQYRVALAWQNGGYNQPPHPSYHLGHDMTSPPRAQVWRNGLVWSGASPDWSAAGAWLDQNGNPVAFTDGDRVLFDLTGAPSPIVSIPTSPQPGELVVHAPETVDYTLDGGLSGTMPLTKAGQGRLTLSGLHSFTGPTRIQQGSLFVDGSLSHSPATVEGRATIGGTGTLGAGLTLHRHARLSPGSGPATPGHLTIAGTLELTDSTVHFDLGSVPDLVSVQGPLVFSGLSTIALRFPDGPPAPGTYLLVRFTGPLSGGLENLRLSGLDGTSADLELEDGNLALIVAAMRPPASVAWRGTGGAWDLDQSDNWLISGTPARFVTGDAVSFGDAGSAAPVVSLAGEMFPSSVVVTGSSSYTITGSGAIGGTGGLAKSGNGVLTLESANTFTGPVSITGGIVEVPVLSSVGSPGPLGAGTDGIRIAGGTLRATGSFSSTDRTIDLDAAGAVIDVPGSASNQVISGTISGSAPLSKAGPGRLTLSGSNPFSGGIAIHAGTLAMGSPGALGSGTVTLAGGTLAMAGHAPPNAVTVLADSIISGGSGGGGHGVKAIGGSGILTLVATDVFDLEGSLAGFSGRIVLSGSGSFRLFGSTGSSAADFDLGSRTLTPRSGTSFRFGSLSGTSGSVLGGAGGYNATVTHTVGGNGKDSVFAGTIRNGTGPVHLTKTGTGTLTLSGECTHTGTTTVSSGALSVTGSLGNTTLIVESGGVLGGTGAIAGPVTVHGTLSPAIGGTLSLQGGLALAPTSVLVADPGAGSAPVDVTGNLTIDGTLHVVATPGPAAGTYALIRHTGALTDNGLTVGSVPGGFTGSIEASGGTVRLVLSATLTAYEQWQTDRFGSTTAPDAAPGADPDGDGTTNEVEFRLGLDPQDGSSSFKAAGILAPGGFTLTWPSAPGLTFEIHRSTTLPGGWQTVATVTGTGVFTDAAPPQGSAFYRVALLP